LDDETLDSFPKKARESLKSMVDVIRECIDERENLRVSDIYDNLLVKTGYLGALEAQHTQEAEGRIENLLDFKSFIYDFEKEKDDAGEEATLDEFLERVSTQSDTDKYDEADGKVTLMTLHSAKGLEFGTVFIAAFEDGIFPISRAFESQTDMEEERRLAYVAITRAKRKLYISSSRRRMLHGYVSDSLPSRFIREIPASLIQASHKERNASSSLGGFNRTNWSNVSGTVQHSNTAPQKSVRSSAVSHTATNFLQNKPQINNETNYSVGQRVRHKSFGDGRIIGIKGSGRDIIVQVAFEGNGIKELAAAFAPLKKI
jgi:DNA helicase-2/ATP-dependent DNA helicase PcrA